MTDQTNGQGESSAPNANALADNLSPEERKLRGMPEPQAKAPEAEAEGNEPEGDEPDGDADDAGADGEDEGGDKPKPKSKNKTPFSKRISELTRKAREAEREIARLQGMLQGRQPEGKPQDQSPKADAKPRLEDYASYDDYQEALTDWKVDQRLKAERVNAERQIVQQRQQQAEQEALQRFQDSAEKAREKYDDFDEVALGDHVQVTPTVARLIAEADDPGEVAYFLGKNPSEARKLAQMSPAKAAIEIGKIEARLSAPPPKKPTNAPKPPASVSGTRGAAPSKPLSKLSQDDFYAKRKAQLAGKG